MGEENVNIIDVIKDEAVSALDRLANLVNEIQSKVNEGADALESYLASLKESIEGEKSAFTSNVVSLQAASCTSGPCPDKAA